MKALQMTDKEAQRIAVNIAVNGNTARVYILHRTPETAKHFAYQAAHLAFILRPDLRESL